MKNKYKIYIVTLIIFTILLTACGGNENIKIEELRQKNEELLDDNRVLLDINKELKSQGSNIINSNLSENSAQNLMEISLNVMESIKNKDMVGLSTHVHPDKGVRFTPYVHINRPFDQVFTSQQVANLNQDITVYNWGYYYDASASEIKLNFNDYYDKFIYDEDFLNANIIGINAVVSWGVMIDNIYDEYEDGEYIEFYIPGETHSEGSYWKSLKLVYEEIDGKMYLVGVIHGQWTDNYGT